MPNTEPDTLDPATLLAWYLEMGVDVAIDETPTNRLAPDSGD